MKLAKKLAVLSLVCIVARPARAQDPVTVLSFGKGVADYFASQEARKEQQKQLELINQQLAQINTKLDDINSKLDTVLEELRALNVKLDESFDREERTRLLAVVRVIGNDYPTWSQDPAKYKQEASAACKLLRLSQTI